MGKRTLTSEEESQMKKDEQIIKQIIKKHGEVINLKETPFVLIEIIRNFQHLFDHEDGGLPGGVPPPPPPPGPADRLGIDNSVILKEILNLSREVKKLDNSALLKEVANLSREVKGIKDRLKLK
jgi:hypothetical protein